jgi:hypothetical protein
MLDKLPYAKGASWDPDKACLPGTRKALLERIENWSFPTDSAGTAEIFWLTGVAGSGKSAIAHSVAQLCSRRQLPLSCFFFVDISGIKDPKILFSTIAYDLSKSHGKIGEQVALAIELDRSLPSASISRQFKELILATKRHLTDKPFVIVIDALDEVRDRESLLHVLADEVPHLPFSFRIFITSRAQEDIVIALSEKPHVHSEEFDIYDCANQDDIRIYVEHRLEDIKKKRTMGNDWPGKSVISEFTNKAEGLFLWVSTVCDYMFSARDPNHQLEMLISEHVLLRVPAEQKMDNTYKTILEQCDWQDCDFADGYHLFMGAIMAAKTPLSASALEALHGSTQSLPVTTTLSPVRSLLSGLTQKQPIKVLHQSFREFITVRAMQTPETQKLYLDRMEHSQRLALLCVELLNRQLSKDMPCTGFLTNPDYEQPGIPLMADDEITEELWYSCRFWIDHLIEVKTPDAGLCDSVQRMMKEHAITWMEILASKGMFRKLVEVRDWYKVRAIFLEV